MILVVDEKNEKLFYLMDEEFSILNSIGKPGDGPNELNEIPKALNHNFEKLGGFYYYLYGQNKVCKYILDESNRAFKDSSHCYQLPTSFYNVQNVFVLDNGKMVGNAGMKEGKLYFFNPLTNGDTTITDFYPKTNEEVSDEFKMYNYLGYLASDTQKDKIVFVNTYFNQIELYHCNGELIREIRRGKSIEEDVAGGGQKNFYYYGVQITDKYIYALYLGENNKNIVKSALGILKSKLQIFDLEGKPIAEIKLDRLVDDFFLNETQNTIYCLSGEDEERVFTKYVLPNLN